MDYTEQTALQRVVGGKCKVSGKEIQMPVGGVGIKTWGAIDYLEKKHGYLAVFQTQ